MLLLEVLRLVVALSLLVVDAAGNRTSATGQHHVRHAAVGI